MSHCWGRGQALRTISNECGWPQFSYVTLPRSFRGGVSVAQMLSIRYLRIDSLCITKGHWGWDSEGIGQ
ncbi:hypothetical protein V8C26DRAFT_415776 [Trichoderma gracile]